MKRLLVIAGVCVLGLVVFVSCVGALFGGEPEPAPTVTETATVNATVTATSTATATVTRTPAAKAQPKTTPSPKPKPKATAKPKPKPKPRPTRRSVYYANCDAVRAAGADPIYEGEPGYSRRLDRDGDGVGCEP